MVLPASRQVLVWSLPTVAFVLSILWYRRRLRGSKRQTDPGGKPDLNSTVTVDTASVVLEPPKKHLKSNSTSIIKSDKLSDNFVTRGEDKEKVDSSFCVPNLLCEVIPTQCDIVSNHTEVAVTAADNTTDKSIIIEDIVLISSQKIEPKCEIEQVRGSENSLLLEKKVTKKEEEQESSPTVIEEEVIKPVTITNSCPSSVINKSTDRFIEKVVSSKPIEEVLETVLEETLPSEHTSNKAFKMTEVEEPTVVSTKGMMNEAVNVTAPAPVLAKISVDLSALEPKTGSTKCQVLPHQARDSANHSPAEAMLASPSISNDSDTHSVGSNDSGKGGSDVTTPVLEEEGVEESSHGVSKSTGRAGSSRRSSTSSRSSACSESGRTARNLPDSSSSDAGAAVVEQKPLPLPTPHTKQPCVFEFVIPQQLVGRLIGKHGCFVQQIKSDTNSSIFVKRHPESPKFKVCAVEGTQADIDEALKLIRKKFPIKKYPGVTLERVMFLPPSGSFPLIPESLQMYLVEGVNNDVILSSLVSAGHMFLQQPTHPTFPVLSRLIMSMTQCYTEDDSPTLPNPAPGIVCAAPSMGGWYRAEVIDVRTEVSEEAEQEGEKKVEAEERTVCDIKFVDYGGFMTLPTSELRQIRTDFMLLPFQATECYLADVTWPEGEEGWSEQATQCVEELTKDQVLQAQVVGYAENCTPFIRLFSSIHGPMSMVMVNEILVHQGLATFFEPVVA